MLDDFRELFQNTSNSTRAEFKRLTDADPKLKEAVIMSRDKLGFAYRQNHPDIAKKFDELSGQEKAAYADYVAKKLGTHISEEIEKVKPFKDAGKSDPKGVKENQNRLRFLQNAQSMLQENLTPLDYTPYSQMTDYQKYKFGQEFGLNYFNVTDKAKLDETADKLQEQARIKREQAKFETDSPWLSLAEDILFPARQNARRRGEDPSWRGTDALLDYAGLASTFFPVLGPVAKLGLAAKVASKLKSPIWKGVARLTPAAGDVAANTAVTTAIDSRNQKAEDEEFGKVKLEQLAKNFGTALAGTALSGLATRKSIPELAKTKVDPYIPNASKWLESKMVNPAEAVRDEMLRKHENIESSLAKAHIGKFYPQEVKDILKKDYKNLTLDDKKKLFEYSITDKDLRELFEQQVSARQVQALKKPETMTDQRVKQFEAKKSQTSGNDITVVDDSELDKLYTKPLDGYDVKKVLEAERKRRTRRRGNI